MAFLDFTLRGTAATARPTLKQRFDVWRSRRALMRLDADGLADVGLTRASAEREASKSIWDVPANWTAR